MDGKDTDFVLTKSKKRLADFANGAQWCVNGEAVDMSDDVPLTKTAFTTKPGTITLPSDLVGGKVEVNKSTAAQGEEVTLTITADEHYELATLTLNGGENVAASVTEGEYTFTMPEGDVTISATFKLKEGYHTITLNVTPEGTAFVSDGKHVAKKGDAISIGAAANYKLVSGKVTDQNGTSVNYGQSAYWLSFNMPDSDVTVTLTTARFYNVSVADVTGGTVNLISDEVAVGKTAAVIVKPDENYRLEQVAATDADGNELPVQEATDAVLHSTMSPCPPAT